MGRYTAWIVLSVASLSLSCGDGLTTEPTTAPPPPPAAGDSFAVFADPDSDFQTTDVRDANNEIMRFDTNDETLVWTATGVVFDGWEVTDNFLGVARIYLVRFGNVNGERRAYFTETGRGTICDLAVVDNQLQIAQTDLLPPL